MLSPITKKAARLGDSSKNLRNVFFYFLFLTFPNAQTDTGFVIPIIRIRIKRLIRIRLRDRNMLVIS